MVLLILTLAMARAMARAISVAPLALIVRIKWVVLHVTIA